jgi:hypothetical protein
MMRSSASTIGRRVACEAVDRDVELIEEHDEHAVVRVPGELEHFPEVVGIAPRGLRRAGLDSDELNRLDGLRLAVLEDLEVRRFQALDDLAVALRVHVDGDEYGLATETRRPLLLRGVCAGP